DTLEVLLSRGADPFRRDMRGFTPLHYAASVGDLSIVERLICAAKDVTSGDVGSIWEELGCPRSLRGDTPFFHLAAQEGYFDVAAFLMKLDGLDPLSTNSDGFIPLHMAVGGFRAYLP
ncbi:unnamed protein product, partial [Discosporangium mesarthrocarpum]